jgi:hypothetical protein
VITPDIAPKRRCSPLTTSRKRFIIKEILQQSTTLAYRVGAIEFMESILLASSIRAFSRPEQLSDSPRGHNAIHLVKGVMISRAKCYKRQARSSIKSAIIFTSFISLSS